MLGTMLSTRTSETQGAREQPYSNVGYHVISTRMSDSETQAREQPYTVWIIGAWGWVNNRQ